MPDSTPFSERKNSERIHSDSIRQALVRAVVIPVVLLFALSATFIFQTSHLLRLSSYVEHTENLLREAFETQKLILDMETGIRGYFIYKDEAFVERYLKAKAELGKNLEELARLVAEDERDRGRVSEINILTREWEDLVEYRLSQASLKTPEPIPERARAAKIRMDRIRVNFDRITRDAETLRNERRVKTEAAVRRSLRIGIALSGVLGIIIMFSTFRQIRSITRTFMTNLRALRRTQIDLQRSHEELEVKVQHRTLALTAANQEMEAFCYSVSHDLRSPLRAIDGFAQAIAEDYATVLDAQGAKYLDFIRAGVQRMNRLIEDLLSLSRLGRGTLAFEAMDLSKLATEVFQGFELSDPSNGTFFVEPGISAYGDTGLLTIALENLIGNARKFTAKVPHSRVEFGVTLAGTEREYFVKDNGAGFDMERVKNLFGAFQRLHSEKEFEGTGIGLATVRRIIHRHGGTIRAEGKVGEGATFFFTLPDVLFPDA